MRKLLAVTMWIATVAMILAGSPMTGGLAAQPGVAAAGAVRLDPVRQLRPDVDLWPLIANPETPAEQRINQTLRRWNKQLVDDVRTCDQGLRDAGFSLSKEDGLNRRVSVTMRGPRFLSLFAVEGYFCGGAHPDGDRIALVFDLGTGELVNWAELNPAASATSPAPDPADSFNGVIASLPVLRELYVREAPAECKDAYQEQQLFLLWPDAESGTLIAQAAGLPHVNEPCVNELKLTMDQARRLGFSEELLSAIELAHRLAAKEQKH